MRFPSASDWKYNLMMSWTIQRALTSSKTFTLERVPNAVSRLDDGRLPIDLEARIDSVESVLCPCRAGS